VVSVRSRFPFGNDRQKGKDKCKNNRGSFAAFRMTNLRVDSQKSKNNGKCKGVSSIGVGKAGGRLLRWQPGYNEADAGLPD